MKSITVNIQGMSCGHCSAAVERAVKGIQGINDIKVSLADKNAQISFDENKTDTTAILSAITEEGYQASL